MLQIIKKILILAIAFNLGISNAYGQLVLDGTTNTQITKGEFDTPVINIAAPNEKGLSHNKFTEYNVGTDNLVINNTKEQNKISKIGGYIKENPNLVTAGREANIILNEVTGTNKTNLNGYTEMLGKNADLVIANPNGINISGAGFINIPKVTLVTGSSNISAEGELEKFNLSDTGIIDISKDSNNLGLSAEDSSLYLSGRYVKIGGNIYANLINILTGSKSFNYLTKEADSYTPSSAPAATEYAVDASSLGGMYAGAITIIGTEEGFGVRNSSTLVTDIGDVTIKSQGKIEAYNINSGKDLYMEATSALTSEDINVTGNIDASGRSITFTNFKSGGDSTLVNSGANIRAENGTVGGNLVLFSTNNLLGYQLNSASDMNIHADGLLTTGSINAANDITLSAYSITQEEDTQAGNNINITAEIFNINSLTSGAEQTLLAYGDINLDLNTLNNSGEIAAFKDIKITSNTLNNNGLILANNALNIEGGDINNNSGASLFGNNALNIKTDGAITNTLGSIYGNNNITIQGLTGDRSGDLTNNGGTIESRNGDINIFSSNINNLSIKNCDPATETCYTTVWADSGEALRWYYHLAPTPLPDIIERQQVATSQLHALEYGKILSGRDINLSTGDIRNESGIISASNIIAVNALNLYNVRSSFDVTLQRDMYFPGTSSLTLYIASRRWTEDFTDTIFSTTPAVISAQSVIINATGTVFNDAYQEGGTSVPFDPVPVSQNFEDVVSGGIINPVSTVDFSYSGLFKQAGPDSSYLYVTTNRFLDKRNYVGADYFFTQTGIDYNKQSTKLIGDVFYEQKLIEDSILRLTGSRSLNGYAESINNQMTYLYNNAALAYGELGLSFGTALTAEQSAKLSKDIIWYVEQEVNGTKVYVPTLYLANASKEKLAQYGSESSIQGDNTSISAGDIINSGRFAADNLQLSAKGDISNISGTIKAENNLEISAGGNIINESKENIKQETETAVMLVTLQVKEQPTSSTATEITPWATAQISSGGQMQLNATGNINNNGGIIKADGNMQAEADNITNSGDILSKNMQLYADNDIHNIGGTIKTENNLDIYAYGNVINESKNNITQDTAAAPKTRSLFSFISGIPATQAKPSLETAQISSGGTLNITAANNFENISADVSSVGDMTIYADKEITIKSHDLKINGNIYHQASNLNSLADMYLYSGGKLDILGSNATAKNALTLSGSDVNILSNIDETYEGKRLKKTNVASNISGAEINVIADNNITVTASNASSSAGNINFEAENVDIKSGINSNTYSASSGSYKLEDSSTNNESSTIESSEDINMIAEDTFELTASDLYAANNINILAKDVNIQSGQDTTHYYRYNVKKRSFNRKKIEEDRIDTITNVSSEVVAGGNLNINSYNDIKIIGSNLTTDNGSMLLQAGNDIDVLAGINQEATLTRREKKGFLGLSGSKDVTYDNIKTLESSSVFSGDDIKLTSGADTTLFASDVGAKGDGSIQTGGDLNVFSGVDSSYHYEEHLEKSFSNVIGGFDGGRAYAGIEYKINESEKSSYDETAKASSISTGGNLSVLSNEDVNITGSDINASAIDIAAKDIKVQEMQEQHQSSSSEKEGTLSATFGIGNAYVDTGYALKALADATKAVEDAKDSLSKMKDLYDQGKATSSAVEDAEINLAAAASMLAYATLQAAQSAANSATAAATGLGTGLYSDVSLKYQLTENNLTEESTTSRSSNILGADNISFYAYNDMLQQGSNVESSGGDVNYNIANNLDLLASKNTFKSEQETKSYTAEVKVGTEGGNAGASLSSSQSRTLSDTYNNSYTQATEGAINYNVGGNMTGSGYNAYAQDINANIGGELNLESLQDTYYANNSSFGINGGYGGGASLGANSGKGYTDMAWVNNQTSLIGGHSVDINAGSIDLKGSTIANIDQEGNDGGNLKISADTLTYSDIKDINNNNQQGFGFQVSTGPLGKASNPAQGSSSVSFSDSSSEKEQITKATIGNGDIVLNNSYENDISNLNRDTSNTQEITKDQITGALDATFTIDNRILTSDGRQQILGQVSSLGDNLLSSAGGAIEGTGRGLKVGYDALDIIGSAASGDIKFSQIAEAIGNNITQSQVVADMHRVCETGCTQQQYDKALVEIANQYGITLEDAKTYMDSSDSSSGFHTRDDKDTAGSIYINQASSQDRAETEGHELSHAYQADNGLPYDNNNENLAELMGGQYSASQQYEDILDILNIFQGDSIGVYQGGGDLAYMLDNNYYAAQIDQEQRENWNDGPNSGQDIGAEGFVKPNTQLYTPEGMSAQTQAAIIGGGIGLSMLPGGQYVLGMLGGYAGTQGFANDLGIIMGQSPNEYGAYEIRNADGTTTYIHKSELFWNTAGDLGLTFFSLLPLLPKIGNTQVASDVSKALPDFYVTPGGTAFPTAEARINNIINNLDFYTPPNKAVFYSGKGSYERAVESGNILIDSTTGGKILNNANIPEPLYRAYWGPASAKYATQASGTPKFYVERALPTSIFKKYELPILKINPKVTLPPEIGELK